MTVGAPVEGLVVHRQDLLLVGTMAWLEEGEVEEEGANKSVIGDEKGEELEVVVWAAWVEVAVLEGHPCQVAIVSQLHPCG